MKNKKKCIAMLLAGGQGSRLGALTHNIAKPAVPFGGKYRIIDFTLSNCVNSGIDTVGVLTQYKPLELNDYIGNGQPWGLDRKRGGVHILQPYAKIKSKSWYEGTANAIYQNIPFIERYCPDYVLVLSGDHIYKMDYEKLMHFHEKNNADCTIATFNVQLSEASRFGILNADNTGLIQSFEEKPKEPKSTKASMGVYVFSWPVLRDYLEQDEKNEKSAHDFGKNIIPTMLAENRRLYAWSFDGYWKDVGTTESLWRANMDLLDPNCSLNLDDDDLRIYTRNFDCPPTFVSNDSYINNSLITRGCTIGGKVVSSIISSECVIEPGATVMHSVLLPGACVRRGASVQYAIVGEGATIESGVLVGKNEQPEEEKEITVVPERKRVVQKREQVAQ